MADQKRIGKYELVSELGRGGMGVVFKAWEESLQRFVAIKMLGDQLVQDETLVERFLREARAVADLNHPNLVQVFAVDTHEGRPYFVMEYVEGESFSELIRTSRQIDRDRALTLVKEAATGLVAAHRKGVIHRDIKPANIMLTKHGGVKVVDFGVARVDDPNVKQLTATGLAIGTPHYISPEVCLGETVNARSDLFSLGIVLFEMLAGETPFQADSPIALMKQVVESEIPDISSLNPSVDTDTRLVLGRLLQKKPAQRYVSCEDLVEDLEALLDGKPPVHAGSSDNLKTTVQTTLPPTQQNPQLGTQSIDKGSSRPPLWAVAALLLLAGVASAALWMGSDSGTDESGSMAGVGEQEVQAQGQEATGALSGTEAELETVSERSEDASVIDEPFVPDSPVSEADQIVGEEPVEAETIEPPEVVVSLVPEQTTSPVVEETPAQVSQLQEQVSQTTMPAPVQGETARPLPAPAAEPQPAAIGPKRVVVLAYGDATVRSTVEFTLENALSELDVELMDETFIDGLGGGGMVDPATAGRVVWENGGDILVIANVRSMGERQLRFYGRTDTEHTAIVEIRTQLLHERRALGPPLQAELQYVSINAMENAREVTAPLAAELAVQLQNHADL